MGFKDFDVFQSIALISIRAQVVPSLSSSGYSLNPSDPKSEVFASFLAFGNDKMFWAYLTCSLSWTSDPTCFQNLRFLLVASGTQE